MNDYEIERGFKLVLENSKSLIEEAKLLFKNGYLPRAYALAQLSIEEIGKSTLLCKAILNYYLGYEINSKYLDNLGFRNHQIKTRQSLKSELIAIWMFEQSIGKKTSLRDSVIDDYNGVENLNNLKNQSLYIGIHDDAFTSPNDLIDSQTVTNLIDKAELRLAAASPLFRSLDDTKASALLLKEVLDDPEKNEELNKRASEEFGINLAGD